jgi:transcriptional regulator with XRE-family HTH domain
MDEIKIRNIVRRARGKLSQADFAGILRKTQGLVSKYENGTASPPSDVIEACLTIIQKNNDIDDVSSEILAERIRNELKGPHLAYARKSIAALLNGIESNEVSS